MLTVLSLLLATAAAKDLHVGPSQPEASISGALGKASAGDTIWVHPNSGGYAENVFIDKNVTIIGVGGAANTLVKGKDSVATVDHTLEVASGVTVEVRGLTLLAPPTKMGRMAAVAGTATFVGVHFVGDGLATQEVAGAGLEARPDAVVTCDGCGFYQTWSSKGGGAVWTGDRAEVTLKWTWIAEARSGAEGGGAIFVGGTTPGALTLENSLISGCQVTGTGLSAQGGAIRAPKGGVITLTGSQFSDNAAPHGGGHVFAGAGGKLFIEGSAFWYGEAGERGGAVQASGSLLSVKGSVFGMNTAVEKGGAIFLAGADGGLYDSSFVANGAPDGAHAYLWPGSGKRADIVSSWFVLANDPDTDGTFTPSGNGGVYFAGGQTTIVGSAFAWNETWAGSGLYLFRPEAFNVSRNVFCANRAAKAGTGNGNGGGLWLDSGSNGTALIQNNVFAWNGADNYGGGAHVLGSGSPKITNNAFLRNAAAQSLDLHISSAFTLHNNLFGHDDLSSFWTPAVTVAGAGVRTATHQAWFEVPKGYRYGGAMGDAQTSSDVFADPMLAAWPPPGDDCQLLDMSLKSGSPLVGSGKGSPYPVDIGALGGLSGASDLHDADGDGYIGVWDCDPANSRVHIGAQEACGDGVDNDCDWLIDEQDDSVDATVLFYPDDDRDGFGRPYKTGEDKVFQCSAGDRHWPGFVTTTSDCDDANVFRHPGGTDLPGDGVDQDCDGKDATPIDGDGDGHLLPSDCDDTDKSVYPGASETPSDGKDSDCDGADGLTCAKDADGDGHGHKTVTVFSPDDDCDDPGEASEADDCDDTDKSRHPEAAETPGDGKDSDCDGYDGRTCQKDGDGDGYGTPSGVFSSDDDCSDPGESTTKTDCDDLDATVNPGAPETFDDNIDKNCDGQKGRYCFRDGDGDGHGGLIKIGSVDDDCSDPGESTSSDDCNDANPGVYPGATEKYDDVLDSDCDGQRGRLCFADADGDGYGSKTTRPSADDLCNGPGESGRSDDCDDAKPLVNPGALEIPFNAVDEDCDGEAEGMCDADGDGVKSRSCGGNDCNDLDPDVKPGATEVAYDGIDNDCAGGDLCDVDADGHDASAGACVGDDCDDGDPKRHPDYTEVPYDGVDNDCDGYDLCDVDEDLARHPLCGGEDCDDDDAAVRPGAADLPYDGIDQDCVGGDLVDVDGDGHAGKRGGGDDCDDLDPEISPSAAEIFYDGVDGDCDGRSDFDQDGDGLDRDLDCDDTDPARSPLADEIPYDGVDNDCDADTPDDDLDGDGFPLDGDCDDALATVHPGADEIPYDDVDQDCDGLDLDDVDGDGWAWAEDCDDEDPTSNPGAEEVWYDGVDQDCDGIDSDRDGDGEDPPPLGPDCDDDDPGRNTRAHDVPNDGVDQDCDGVSAATELGGGGGCQHAGGGLWPLALLALRRRCALARGRGGGRAGGTGDD